MWALTEDEYTQTYLVPADAAFKSTRSLPDCFTRYGLPITADDEADIQAAVEAVRGFWTRLRSRVPKFQQILALLMEPAEDEAARITLLDRQKRHKERIEKAARERAEKLYVELDADIAIATADGAINAGSYQKILDKWLARGLQLNQIEARVKVPIVTPRSRLPVEGTFSKGLRDRIQDNLLVLQCADVYAFLSIPKNAAPAKVKEAIVREKQKWLSNPNDPKKTAAETILSTLSTACANGDLSAYEQGLLWSRVQLLRGEMEIVRESRRLSNWQFRQLVDRGIQHGLIEQEAELYVEELAAEMGLVLEVTSGSDRIRCSSCGAQNDAAVEYCSNSRCGKPLRAACQGCGQRAVLSEASCPNCALVRSVFPQVLHELLGAKTALSRRALIDARRHMDRSRTLWPGVVSQAEYKNVAQQLEAIQTQVSNLTSAFQQQSLDRKLFAANTTLIQLQQYETERLAVGGRPVEEARREISQLLQKVADLVRNGNAEEDVGRRTDAVAAYRQALAIASDCDAARQGLDRCVPRAPAQVTAQVTGDAVMVSWPPTGDAGRVTYVVRRAAGQPPATPAHGQLIARTTSTSVSDTEAEPGVFCFYSVFAEQDGYTSAPAQSEAICVICEVSDANIKPGNGFVSGSWRFGGQNATVRVTRKQPGFFKSFSGTREIAVSAGQFVDRAVENGQTYEYKISVLYKLPDGRIVETRGHSAAVVPQSNSLGCMGILGIIFACMIFGFVILVVSLSR